MDSARNTDSVEQLAWKYMQKCKVESSTESESDNNFEIFGEGFPATMGHGSSRRTGSLALQFLDPYEADSEETATHSDCSIQSHFPGDSDPVVQHSTPRENKGIGAFCGPQGSALLPISTHGSLWDSSDIPVVTSSDVWMKSGADLETTPHTPLKYFYSPSKMTGFSDLSMDSGVVTEVSALQACPFLAKAEDATTAPPHSASGPTSVTSEENSDFNIYDSFHMAKRKLGLKMDSSYEKSKRKRARIAEIME
ncbi:uncharacterized protein LOC108699776 isoform X2 [Xenopus laevis]|nr:uncharacterized protein LOC108699776 isoform X2 [Xenopus laevis]